MPLMQTSEMHWPIFCKNQKNSNQIMTFNKLEEEKGEKAAINHQKRLENFFKTQKIRRIDLNLK